jgi:hypothetical protein
MIYLLSSHIACLFYGAGLGWAVTHWTAVKTAEKAAAATVTKLLGGKQSNVAAAAPAP